MKNFDFFAVQVATEGELNKFTSQENFTKIPGLRALKISFIANLVLQLKTILAQNQYCEGNTVFRSHISGGK